MASIKLMMFHSFTRVYGGMFGSCSISSKSDTAFAALTAGVNSPDCRTSIESFAARLIFLGVVLSSGTASSTLSACFIFSSYSAAFRRREDFAQGTGLGGSGVRGNLGQEELLGF